MIAIMTMTKMKKSTKRVTRPHARCTQQCPKGNRCALEMTAKHTLCVCSDPECYCHSRQRYEVKEETNGQIQTSG